MPWLVGEDVVAQALRRAAPTLTFVGAFALLDAVIDARFPGPEPKLWYLLPSLDVAALFALVALLELRGIRLRRRTFGAVAALLVFVRVIRFGDGIEALREVDGRFNVYVEGRLFPEFVRLMHSTLPRAEFWVGAVLLTAAIAALGFLNFRLLCYGERYLAVPAHARGLLIALGALVLLSPPLGSDALRTGAFGRSVVPRLIEEARFAVHADERRSLQRERVEAVQHYFESAPRNLKKLGGADVLLFLVEAYGKAVLDRPEFAARIAESYAVFEAELGARGFAIASAWLDAPTYGGRSWLSHATLGTAIRTTDELEYEVVRSSAPITIAQLFRAAGYRTVLVQPNTTRPWPEGEFYGFDQKYFAWDFDYRGPRYAWAEMPDQYVLDFVRQKERLNRSGPLFIEYALVTSHAPWSHLPKIVPNWAEIGDGSVYKQLGSVDFHVSWIDLAAAGPAYLTSVIYDLEVLRRYVASFVNDDTLVIVLGDHQPVADVAARSPDHGVPIHVMSRNADLVGPFEARGYTRGMRPSGRRIMATELPSAVPQDTTRYAGLESFLSTFVRDFSE